MHSALSLAFFTISLSLYQYFIPTSSTYAQINFLYFLLAISSLFYWKILSNKDYSKPPLKVMIPIVFLCFLVTPNFLQNDQFRYIWDGINTANGLNPYSFSPKENPLFKSTIWAQIINHPELETIYPPLAQGFFFISTYLNPFFYLESFTTVSNLHSVVFGWKMFFAITFSATIYLARKRKWELIICHPLFLYTAFSNNHLDALLIPPMMFILSSHYAKDRAIKGALFFTSMILVKWYPVILAPLVFIKEVRKTDLKQALSNVGVSLSIIFFAIMLFFRGASESMFSSLVTFGEVWFFNGFFHLLFGDFLSLFFIKQRAYEIAKIIVIISAVLSGIVIIINYWKERISFKRSLLYMILAYLLFTPTLMPWYLLIILPFLIYLKSYGNFLWIWPILTMSSKAYFYQFSDPYLVRYMILAILIVLLLQFIKTERSYIRSTY